MNRHYTLRNQAAEDAISAATAFLYFKRVSINNEYARVVKKAIVRFSIKSVLTQILKIKEAERGRSVEL
jgi:hypothetical protein